MDATLTAPPRAVPDHRTLRLAELVQHLTGCGPAGALHAVEVNRREGSADDALDIVARAIVSLRRIDLRDRPAR